MFTLHEVLHFIRLCKNFMLAVTLEITFNSPKNKIMNTRCHSYSLTVKCLWFKLSFV